MNIFAKITAALLIMWLFSATVSATEYEFGADDAATLYPEAEMGVLFESLPDGVKDELESFVASHDDAARLEAVEEKLDLRYWILYVARSVVSVIFPAFSGCASLLCIIIISSVMKKLLTDGSCSEICNLAVSLITAVSVGNIALQAVDAASAFISRISVMMNAMLPVMNAVMISSGSLTQMSVNSAALMLYLTVTENLTDLLLIPLAGALFALCTVTGVFKGVNVSAMISGIRRLLMTLISFSLLIYSFIMGIQSSLAKSADSFTMKTVRFAVGSYVPIVGGAVSDALTTVTAGLSHVRKITGAVGVIIILLTVLPTLVSLFITRLSLLICKSAAETLECDCASVIIGDADSVLTVFLAFCAMSGVFFIFAVVLFMNSGLS